MGLARSLVWPARDHGLSRPDAPGCGLPLRPHHGAAPPAVLSAPAPALRERVAATALCAGLAVLAWRLTRGTGGPLARGGWSVLALGCLLLPACLVASYALALQAFDARVGVGLSLLALPVAVLVLAARWLSRWQPGRTGTSGALLGLVLLLGSLVHATRPPGPGDIGVSLRLAPQPDPGTATHGTPRPNIVLIVLDSLRARNVSCYGYPRQTTPHIDAFAREAVLYSNFLAPGNWSLPSHASLFTGLYPSRHGAHRLATAEPGAPSRPSPLAPELHTLAEILSDEGYATAVVSANFAVLSRFLGLQQGFRYAEALPAARVGYRPLLHRVRHRLPAWSGLGPAPRVAGDSLSPRGGDHRQQPRLDPFRDAARPTLLPLRQLHGCAPAATSPAGGSAICSPPSRKPAHAARQGLSAPSPPQRRDGPEASLARRGPAARRALRRGRRLPGLPRRQAAGRPPRTAGLREHLDLRHLGSRGGPGRAPVRRPRPDALPGGPPRPPAGPLPGRVGSDAPGAATIVRSSRWTSSPPSSRPWGSRLRRPSTACRSTDSARSCSPRTFRRSGRATPESATRRRVPSAHRRRPQVPAERRRVRGALRPGSGSPGGAQPRGGDAGGRRESARPARGLEPRRRRGRTSTGAPGLPARRGGGGPEGPRVRGVGAAPGADAQLPQRVFHAPSSPHKRPTPTTGRHRSCSASTTSPGTPRWSSGKPGTGDTIRIPQFRPRESGHVPGPRPSSDNWTTGLEACPSRGVVEGQRASGSSRPPGYRGSPGDPGNPRRTSNLGTPARLSRATRPGQQPRPPRGPRPGTEAAQLGHQRRGFHA